VLLDQSGNERKIRNQHVLSGRRSQSFCLSAAVFAVAGFATGAF
jgi:hypothetical protein